MSKEYTICFLVGFDRCGSSMISKVLAQHPQVNLLFQPFNGTEVTQTQWQRWSTDDRHLLTQKFLEGLQKGQIDHNYIRSDWFVNHSSSIQMKPRKLNLVKDTKFHFKLDWLQNFFPKIQVYGIWRQPEEILYSLLKNGFHKSWYGYLTPDLLRNSIAQFERLSSYTKLLDDQLEDFELMAIGIAIRTEILFNSINPVHWIVYEDVVGDPDFYLNKFISRFNLPTFDFHNALKHDYNVVGEFSKNKIHWKDFFSLAQQDKIKRIFSNLEAHA